MFFFYFVFFLFFVPVDSRLCTLAGHIRIARAAGEGWGRGAKGMPVCPWVFLVSVSGRDNKSVRILTPGR
jgi:hypothetical protein